VILDLMLYSSAIATLVAIAGLALERIAASREFPRRGVWVATLLVSLVIPAINVLERPQPASSKTPLAVPAHVRPEVAPAIATRSASVSNDIAGAAVSAPRSAHSFEWLAAVSLEKILRPLWLATSLGLVGFYGLVWLRLRLEAKNWRRLLIHGQVVWVTEALGPAVYGFMRPIILVPQWVINSSDAERALVLAHEQEHIAARDPGILLLGLLTVAIAPWNLPMWWQLRRLRFAMEVDCDARVLAGGAGTHAYGQVLLSIGQRRGFAPAGAIALTEPASQLLRRIRIMTAPTAVGGKWLLGALIGLSLCCLAVAAELQAPVLRAKSAAAAVVPTQTLRKPPLGEDPRLAQVRTLVRVTYPELFDSAAAPGAVLVTLLMNQDGTLYRSYKEKIEPRPWISYSIQAFDAMGVDYEHRGDWVRDRMPGWPASGNHVDVSAWYLKEPADPTRDVTTVREKVETRYASLFRPQYADGASVIAEGSSLLTVFMTESGDIDRVKVEVSEGTSKDAVVGLGTLATPDRFIAMGIAPDRIGPIGTTELLSGHFSDDRDLRVLRVIYAWPRRPDEPETPTVLPDRDVSAGVNDDPSVNRAIAEHYFSDLYTHPTAWPRADPWVLLDRQGKVLETGRRVLMSGADLRLFLESVYPGIKTDGFQATVVHGKPGQRADVAFTWLAADSPLADPSQADLSGRDALLMYADVIGEGMTRPSDLVALKLASPEVTESSLKNPFGVVHVQLTAVEIGADAATVRVRVHHALLPSTAETADVPGTAWQAESASVRVPYGASAAVQVTDQDGKAWKIVLHPERLGSARG
jgi:beta-lactamase regulating signal transducer with metallopeptidase domain